MRLECLIPSTISGDNLLNNMGFVHTILSLIFNRFDSLCSSRSAPKVCNTVLGESCNKSIASFTSFVVASDTNVGCHLVCMYTVNLGKWRKSPFTNTKSLNNSNPALSKTISIRVGAIEVRYSIISFVSLHNINFSCCCSMRSISSWLSVESPSVLESCVSLSHIKLRSALFPHKSSSKSFASECGPVSNEYSTIGIAAFWSVFCIASYFCLRKGSNGGKSVK
mmetsp:Transcript_21321/g.27061  ORF Transcript_21321/g.27061 Transcript_21321/m.27061 type:complete len:223 (-) Transcript_21321:434-1102(-)